MSNRAWVTLATNDSYGLGALVLAHSLRRADSAYPAVVLITPAVTDAMRDRLSAVFAEVVTVDVLDSKDAAHLALLQRPELGITFTKIHCWGLTQYEKCVFLDADTLVVQNSDELFEREELSAAPDVGWPDCFNSGVFVFKPSKETFDALIKFAQERGSFDGGDQGLLNSFFSDWARGDINKHLPFLYNVTSAAFYSYLPAFKHFGQDLKIIHFIGVAKPWLQNFNWDTQSVDAPDHLRGTLQLWWDIFVSNVHAQLDTAMTGVAGVLARVASPGAASGDRSAAIDELTRRQGWEQGNIDYMGADSFDNIWAKISQTLNQAPPKEPSPPKDIKQPSPPKEVVAAEQPAPVTQPAPVDPTPDVVPVTVAEPVPVAVPVESAQPQVAAPAESVQPPAAAPTEIVQPSAAAPTETAQPTVTDTPAVPSKSITEEKIEDVPVPALQAAEAQIEAVAAQEASAAPVEQPQGTPAPSESVPEPVPSPKEEPVEQPLPAAAPVEPSAAESVPTPEPTPVSVEAPASTEEVKPEAVVPPTPPATPKSTPETATTPVTESLPPVETPSPIVEASTEAPVAAAAPVSEETKEPAATAEVVLEATEAAPSVTTPEKSLDITGSATDSPPLATTPGKEDGPSEPSPKSAEEGAQETRL